MTAGDIVGKYATALAIFASTFSPVALSAGEHVEKQSGNVLLAVDGKAMFPITVSASSSPEVRSRAVELSMILKRMTGAEFKVCEGAGTSGIAVGTTGDFPEIPFNPVFDLSDHGEFQGYEIKSHPSGVYVIGASPAAVGYAVYDFLYRLGYRRYFPSEKWEIVPHLKKLEFASHIRETPDYCTRQIWFSYGVWPEYQKSIDSWSVANRNGGFPLNISHIYQKFIMDNKKVFDEHPEYYGLVDGKRNSNKLCISNPDLRKLFADFVTGMFEKYPSLQCYSAEPSDGGGWCECGECVKLGSISDRVVLLANTAASAVREKFPGKMVGINSYNKHSAPSAIGVNDNVIVCVCTNFIRSGLTLDQILDGWAAKKVKMGIYDYFDVYLWSFNLPNAKAGNINYLKTSIPGYYEKGARYFTAESDDSWGGNGLGYYLADRILWNVREARNMDALIEDFLVRCFGPASNDMKEFYKLIDVSNGRLLCGDTLGRMYRSLAGALEKASGNPDAYDRIADLVLYARFTEMYVSAKQALTKEQQVKAVEELLSFIASIKNTRMVHSKAFFADRRTTFNLKFDKLPGDWKIPVKHTPEQIRGMVTVGVAANSLVDFEAVRFSDRLVPAPILGGERFEGGIMKPRTGIQTYYTWIDDRLNPLEFSLTGGLIKHYRDRGNVKVELWKVGGESDTGEEETLIMADASVPPDGVERRIALKAKQPGLHKIIMNDGGDMTDLKWKSGTVMTRLSSFENPVYLHGTLCFYVPRKTKFIGFYCDVYTGEITSPDSQTRFKFNRTLGYHSIPVPDGMDGRTWKLQINGGRIVFMTVPQCVAAEPAGLLLPEDVVRNDNLK